jgi:hypothetical protein
MRIITRERDMTNAYRISNGNHDRNRKVRELNGKQGGNMRRESVGAAVLTCCMIGSSWLVVVNTAVNMRGLECY